MIQDHPNRDNYENVLHDFRAPPWRREGDASNKDQDARITHI